MHLPTLTLTASIAVPAECTVQRLRSVPVSQTLSAESLWNASHAVLGIHQGLGRTFQYIFIEQKAPQEQTKNETSNEKKKPESSCTASHESTVGIPTPFLLPIECFVSIDTGAPSGTLPNGS